MKDTASFISNVVMAFALACVAYQHIKLLLRIKREKGRRIEANTSRRWLIPSFEHGCTPAHEYAEDSRNVFCAHVPVYSSELAAPSDQGRAWKWVCTKCGTRGSCRFKYMPTPVSVKGKSYLEVVALLGHTRFIRDEARRELIRVHPGHPIQHTEPQ